MEPRLLWLICRMGNYLTHLVIQLGLMPKGAKTPHPFAMVGLADISWRGKVSILVGLMGYIESWKRNNPPANGTILSCVMRQQTKTYYKIH